MSFLTLRISLSLEVSKLFNIVVINMSHNLDVLKLPCLHEADVRYSIQSN